MNGKKTYAISFLKNSNAVVSAYGTDRVGKSVYISSHYVNIEDTPLKKIYDYLCKLTGCEFNSIEIVKYTNGGKMSLHTDGNQVEDGSSIVTHVAFNSTLILYHNQAKSSCADKSNIYKVRIPSFCSYGFLYDAKSGGLIQPSQIWHQRCNSFSVKPGEPVFALVFRKYKQIPEMVEYAQRFARENGLLKKFDNLFQSVTVAGKIKVPEKDEIQHVITREINKAVFSECKPGTYFRPGDKFHKNQIVLQILSLHNALGKCFAICDSVLVSCVLSDCKLASVTKKDGDLFVKVKRPVPLQKDRLVKLTSNDSYLPDVIVQQNKKKKNIVRIFLGSKYDTAMVQRKFSKSIYFLGYFVINSFDVVTITFKQVQIE